MFLAVGSVDTWGGQRRSVWTTFAVCNLQILRYHICHKCRDPSRTLHAGRVIKTAADIHAIASAFMSQSGLLSTLSRKLGCIGRLGLLGKFVCAKDSPAIVGIGE